MNGLKFIYIINILLFFFFSLFYFNRKSIKLNWKWHFLKITTMVFWIYSSFLVVQSVLVINPITIFFVLINFTSLLLFAWTYRTTSQFKFDNIFTHRAPQQIINTGPYRFIRHPYYTSYMINYLSILFISQSILLIIPIALIIVLYYFATQNEEELILNSEHKNLYGEYKEKTKRFVPFLF